MSAAIRGGLPPGIAALILGLARLQIMSRFIVLATDTDVGKTTFSLLWLHAFASAYWKPVETGASDSELIARLVPGAVVHPPVMALREPVAPPLAARREGRMIPSARELAIAMPTGDMLVESFGSPFSPLNDSELQVELVRDLALPSVLVASSALGAIGRVMQCWSALDAEGLRPTAIVLLGMRDVYAEDEIRKHTHGSCVVSLERPTAWTIDALRECATRQREQLDDVHGAIAKHLDRYVIMPSPSKSDAFPRRDRQGAADNARTVFGRPLPDGRGSERIQSVDKSDTFRGARSNPKTLLADDRRCVWHPYTPLEGSADPLVVVGAKDEFLELADGSRVIDGISSWWTILHGHRHPPLMRALAEAASRIDHVLFAGVTHPAAVELADLLLGTMPWCGGRVFYSDNGSTAVEVALKMAYQYWCHLGEPGRTRFIGFEHGYHGDTFGAMAVSRDPVFFGCFEPLLFRADILPIDANRLDDHLKHHAHETAAIIIEPLVQGAGGMRMHTPQMLSDIAEVAKRHSVLFIADEVMTGGGRTGTLWAHQAAGVGPDFVCAAKTLTGGILPLAATLVSPRIVKAFQSADRVRTFFHGHSFTANPLACAVAACNMRSMLKSQNEPKRIEAFWSQALNPLRDDPNVVEVRIRGTIAAIELAGSTGYLAEIGPQLHRFCLQRGVFLRPLGNVLYALPPFCTTEESLRQIAATMADAVSIDKRLRPANEPEA